MSVAGSGRRRRTNGSPIATKKGDIMYTFFAHLPVWMLKGLNLFFFGFHTLFTLFNLVGWIWRRTRKLHLVTMALTAFSWLVLGIFYGLGFCFCTQWHWEVRELLGYHDVSSSYIHLLLTKLFQRNFNERLVIEGTKWAFILIILGMIIVWGADLYKKVIRRR